MMTKLGAKGTRNLSFRTTLKTYNNDFNLQSMSYAGGTSTYTYDNDGLLSGVNAFSITRDARNGLPLTVSNGTMNTTNTFNGYGEVESRAVTVGTESVSSWSVTRDGSGRIATKTETINGVTSTYSYTYDPVGRLVSATKDGTTVETYGYNLNGTRTSETNTLRGVSRSLTYSDEDHLLTAGDTTYQYDVDGFLTSKQEGASTSNYVYSARGELLSVTLPNGDVIEYVHDPLGRRIATKVSGIITEKYLWQGQTRLLAVYDGADNLIMRFEYANDRMPASMSYGGATYYLTYDQIGSLKAVTDSSGTVEKRIDYDSFGNILSDTNPGFFVPIGFAGGLLDPDTKLLHFGARDYDPTVGRWTAKDPIGFAGGDTDLYGYVLNDPVNGVDPAGQARIGSRPLNSEWIPPSINGKGAFRHDQIWYDNGSNSGFFDDDRIRSDTGHTIDEYSFSNDTHYYGDSLMRQAEQNVQRNWNSDYDTLGNNCQGYAYAVREEYKRLERLQQNKRKC